MNLRQWSFFLGSTPRQCLTIHDTNIAPTHQWLMEGWPGWVDWCTNKELLEMPLPDKNPPEKRSTDDDPRLPNTKRDQCSVKKFVKRTQHVKCKPHLFLIQTTTSWRRRRWTYNGGHFFGQIGADDAPHGCLAPGGRSGRRILVGGGCRVRQRQVGAAGGRHGTHGLVMVVTRRHHQHRPWRISCCRHTLVFR